MRIALSPQCSGFHFSTGGSFFSSASRAMSARLRPARSEGGGGIGMALGYGRGGSPTTLAAQPGRFYPAAMASEFDGPRTAIVTGGAKRIGSALCRALAADGWHLLIHCNRSLDEAEALAAELGNAAVVSANLAEIEAPARIVAALDG